MSLILANQIPKLLQNRVMIALREKDKAGIGGMVGEWENGRVGIF